jgi:hypothetical protein
MTGHMCIFVLAITRRHAAGWDVSSSTARVGKSIFSLPPHALCWDNKEPERERLLRRCVTGIGIRWHMDALCEPWVHIAHKYTHTCSRAQTVTGTRFSLLTLAIDCVRAASFPHTYNTDNRRIQTACICCSRQLFLSSICWNGW